MLRPGHWNTDGVETGALDHVEMSDLDGQRSAITGNRIKRVADVDAAPHPRTVPMAASERIAQEASAESFESGLLATNGPNARGSGYTL